VSLALTRLDGAYAVARAAPGTAPPPALFRAAGLVSVTATPAELSVVAPSAALEGFAHIDPGWAAFEVAGPLDFALTGILAGLSGALAEAGIALFALSTYDTDYILVKETDAEAAAAVWRAVGHRVD